MANKNLGNRTLICIEPCLIVGVDEFELHALELHARAVRPGRGAVRHLFEVEDARLQLVNGDGPLKHFVFQTARESVSVSECA